MFPQADTTHIPSLLAILPQTHAPGVAAEPLPRQLWHHDWTAAVLLLCFLAVVYMLARSRQALAYQASTFFFSPRSTLSSQAHPTLESHVVLLAHLPLTLGVALLYYAWALPYTDPFLLNLSPLGLYAIYAGCVALCLLVKHYLAEGINNVFFTEGQCSRWRDSRALLLCIESLGAFVLALVFLFCPVPRETALQVTLGALILLKLLLAYKCLTIFFNRSYLFLHLFAYLCTLEIAPLLVLWHVLGKTAYFLTLN